MRSTRHETGRFGVAAIVSLAALVGCSPVERPKQTPAYLMDLRARATTRNAEGTQLLLAKLLDRARKEYDDHAARPGSEEPVIDVLIISGGGDWGAFGCGVLKGWGRVPAGSPMARPKFDVVSGVSTGALIAPFAFLGTDDAIDQVEHLYRNPQEDWVRQRGWLYFMPNNVSFAEIPGLEREVDANFDKRMIARISAASGDGRALVVNTTNVDDGSAHVFDLVGEARRAEQTGDEKRFRTIILASAGIPGGFPFRIIDDEMYVDGGVTGNIVYGGRLREDQTLPALWQKAYPGQRMPKTRFWVIYNNQVQPPPQVTGAHWPPVVARSVALAISSSTVSAIRHLYAMSEISRLKRGAEVEVRYLAIPDDWSAPKPGVFVKETMNELADIGERMGADPSSWKTEAP